MINCLGSVAKCKRDLMYRYSKSLLSLLVFSASLVIFSGCSQRFAHYGHTSKARYKATMRTYRVRGRTYHPTYVAVGDTMRGISSWYGPNFHGKQTSNGERYNMHGYTAAHKTWPMDTMVKVQNIKNGKSVIVRINDRGPFVSGRIIDCSYAAGKKIGLDRLGIAKVKLTVLGFAGKVYKPKKKVTTSGKVVMTVAPKIKLDDFGVQVGAFRRYEGAVTFKLKHQDLIGTNQRVIVKKFIVDDEPLYRVWIMGFGSDSEARDFISDNGIQGGFLIRK